MIRYYEMARTGPHCTFLQLERMEATEQRGDVRLDTGHDVRDP